VSTTVKVTGNAAEAEVEASGSLGIDPDWGSEVVVPQAQQDAVSSEESQDLVDADDGLTGLPGDVQVKGNEGVESLAVAEGESVLSGGASVGGSRMTAGRRENPARRSRRTVSMSQVEGKGESIRGLTSKKIGYEKILGEKQAALEALRKLERSGGRVDKGKKSQLEGEIAEMKTVLGEVQKKIEETNAANEEKARRRYSAGEQAAKCLMSQLDEGIKEDTQNTQQWINQVEQSRIEYEEKLKAEKGEEEVKVENEQQEAVEEELTSLESVNEEPVEEQVFVPLREIQIRANAELLLEKIMRRDQGQEDDLTQRLKEGREDRRQLFAGQGFSAQQISAEEERLQRRTEEAKKKMRQRFAAIEARFCME